MHLITAEPHRFGVAVILYTWIQEVHGLNLGQVSGYPEQNYLLFSQYHHKNGRITQAFSNPYILTIHNCLTISFDDI
jgi:hypothetical protein